MNYDAIRGLALLGFLAKKIISAILYPLGLAITLLCASLFFLREAKGKKRAYGFFLVVAGIIVLLLPSLPLTARFLTEPLERAAGPYCEPEALRSQGVNYIVVLAGSLVLSELGPADGWGPSLPRIMEGIRLARDLPESVLVLSGGCLPHIKSQPEAMKVLPTQLGIQPTRLLIKVGALDTRDEANVLQDIIREAPFALVTSAIHMKRAQRLFSQNGMHPIACPCARRIWPDSPWYHWIIPNATSLKDSTDALHEYLGIVWAYMRK